MRPMPARIEVLDADVTRLDVDAIANAANTRLHHGGGVALAIAEAAGEALIRESEQRAPIGLGEAIETTGGDLPARWVIHAATMHPDGQTGAAVIAKATAATLERAEALEVRSLALVAFGTGVGGFPVDQAAELVVGEVPGCAHQTNPLRTVSICSRATGPKRTIQPRSASCRRSAATPLASSWRWTQSARRKPVAPW